MTGTRTLLVSGGLALGVVAGREKLSRLHFDVLGDLLGDELDVFREFDRKESFLARNLQAAMGYLDGMSAPRVEQILTDIRKRKIGRVFIDGSNYGILAERIKRSYPDIKIITFFHNVEVRFFLGALRYRPTLRGLLIVIANYLAEKKAVYHSDVIICLNRRDSDLLRKIYGRSADFVSPMCLRRQPAELNEKDTTILDDSYCLFVGGEFYANLAGLRWFIKYVLPRLKIKLYVVGRGMERHRSVIETHERVVLIGEVESISRWYRAASCVVAPIFDGSGMKTKVAEALMFGKKIVGTPEAFVGYEHVVSRAGCVCETPKEFAHAITNLSSQPVHCDLELQSIFSVEFSYEAAKRRMAELLAVTQ